ncbi:xanthine dehydrogenase family protein molybdopterin-binding subunit [Vreelandella boliviensis]|uniref:xanthine dehydrogenase family protein molybdopterin-binding subunit n=1 Tax=Vreelandella boliviensis TaxID=223527 RepID=UPI001B8BBB53|nr:xanthine dehydrogenase family protein molybdopterin-binding subunit [Halomonas boliviensis]MBS3666399.1 xanthine dehydrogenase family protein molybdopterin-binding subunit [Halomonas boliviensis]
MMTLQTTPDRPRIDAREKVLGRALYAADIALDRLLHAITVPATIAKGRVTAIDTALAIAEPGVVRVYTHEDFADDIAVTPATLGGNQPGLQPMTDTMIRFRGQPVALVVAETLEAACEAARLVRVSYRVEPFTATMDELGSEAEPYEITAEVGDAHAALQAAEVTVDVVYAQAQNHHNPIELISTTAYWRAGKLTILEGTQNTSAIKFGTAGALGFDPSTVDAISPYVGGAFGQKTVLQLQSALVSRAAVLLGRPVKLVMPRAQLFHTAAYRPRSNHRIQLGASRDGRLVATIYESDQQNARYDHFYGTSHNEMVSHLYGIANWLGRERLIRVDTSPPGYMRAPHEHPASFAIESAIDELAYSLEMDPIALRLVNDTDQDPITGKPFSSRTLARCLERGAELFGWDRRSSAPRAMTTEDGTLIGWGVAAGAYKGSMCPAIARLRIQANGVTRLFITGHEMGQGIRSAIAAELMEVLTINPDKLDIQLGDTTVAAQHLTAGSWGTGSAVPATRAVAEKMKVALTNLVGELREDDDVHRKLMAAKRPMLEVEVEQLGLDQTPAALDRMSQGAPATAGPIYDELVAFSWIAHFVEVHVDPTTMRVRVPRVVSVADCGRVMNRRTATSQVQGGVVWGIGAALQETAEIDPRYGFIQNNDLADYVVPVNADIGDITVELLDIPDAQLNASGVKGVGEVAMVGASAAVANAVFHATGKRIRHLPIRIEDLLQET